MEVAKDKVSTDIVQTVNPMRGKPPKVQAATQVVPKLGSQKPKTIAKKTLAGKPKAEEIKC